MKGLDKIDWAKVRDLREQYELILWLCNRLTVLPQNDSSHAIEAVRQAIIEEIGGQDTKGG